MPIPNVAESFAGSVNQVTLGADSQSGGSRTSTVTIGGAKNVVYGGSPEDAGQKPVIAGQDGFKFVGTRHADQNEFRTLRDVPGRGHERRAVRHEVPAP